MPVTAAVYALSCATWREMRGAPSQPSRPTICPEPSATATQMRRSSWRARAIAPLSRAAMASVVSVARAAEIFTVSSRAAARADLTPRSCYGPRRGIRAGVGPIATGAGIARPAARGLRARAGGGLRAHRTARGLRALRPAAPAVLRRPARAHELLVRLVHLGPAQRSRSRVPFRARREHRAPGAGRNALRAPAVA